MNPSPESQKRCIKCQNPGPFGLDSARKDGLDPYCRTCKSEQRKAWKTANRTKVRAQNARYRKRYHDKERARTAAWRASHPEQYRAILAATKRAHPERCQADNRRRRARRAGVESTLTAAEWTEILEIFHHACAYCLVDLRTLPQRKRTQDHVIPLVDRGGHTADNVVPSCQSCNSKKRDSPVWVMT